MIIYLRKCGGEHADSPTQEPSPSHEREVHFTLELAFGVKVIGKLCGLIVFYEIYKGPSGFHHSADYKTTESAACAQLRNGC